MLRRFAPSLSLAVLLTGAPAWAAEQRAVALISIDGMHPDYVLKADEHGLRIPNLRRFLRDGIHASSVRGVLPTVTYPSHTTMITGVWPAKHGIGSNVAWDPLRKNQDGWNWYSEDIQSPTLWQAASRAGYTVGSISWPVSVGAPGVQFNIPEYWRAQTEDDLKLLHAISTPGLIEEFQKSVGPYSVDLNAAQTGDWFRTHYAIALIQKKGVRFLTLHLGALDHLEHDSGPFSPAANKALEEIDRMIGEIDAAMRTADPKAAVCLVSDHGFATVDHELNLNVAFVSAGLMTPNPKTGRNVAGILDWKAEPWIQAGSAAIVLKDPKDQAVRNQVERLLHTLAADPNNGIAQILESKAIATLGGTPAAAFWVDMKTNYSIGSALSGPLVRTTGIRGTHGYSPTHPELQASFLLLAPDTRKGVDLGAIDMRSFAPTLAVLLGVPFPSADLKSLPVLQPVAK
jgi:predicted AlkP superfamily pyrophosphatase or phosphodiesterase